MTSLRKKIATAFIATALIVPTTTSIASAQSSFVSGSSSSAETPGTNHGSKANQLKEAAERVLVANGQIKSPTAEASAKKLIQRALSYELYYQDDAYETIEYSPASYGAVVRIPINEIDERIASIGGEFDAEGHAFPFGVATGKDANYYYLAFVILAG